MKSIYQRVRAAQKKQADERLAAEYKAGETLRWARAARMAAEMRRENPLDDVLEGRAEPRTRAELDALTRSELGADFDEFEGVQS